MITPADMKGLIVRYGGWAEVFAARPDITRFFVEEGVVDDLPAEMGSAVRRIYGAQLEGCAVTITHD